jgi:paired amphipathic helix protein Sin3a
VQSLGPTTPQEELMFFERAKRALEVRDVYDDFLKLLNMYTRDIIDLKTLVVRAEKFFADDTLHAQFKRLVNWDDRIGNVNYGPPGSIRTGPHDAALLRPVDDAQGPSYRRLPESVSRGGILVGHLSLYADLTSMRTQEIRLATSGRDQLALSVLNDEWVSHPTWASEEAGFVAHKKNSFEEVIHRCEDERHEYQIQLEGLARTIGILEPLAARLNEMPVEERAALRLRPELGGQSRWIYMRTLKKVYGKDAGTEIYQALQDAPAVAVPVVLVRLKQKNEEWRRAQREWSHTWRQVDARNFYKSLDHTGINFKQNDKKTITTKAFVGEIEGVRTEQEQKQAREEGRGRARPACTRGSLGVQLSYSFADSGVLCDALKLVYSYLDHNQATYSLAERRSVERFLRAFMPVLCMLPPAAFNAACGPPEIGAEDDSADEQLLDEVVPPRPRANAGGGGGGGIGGCGVHAGDLRKKLARAAAQEKQGAQDGGSRVSTPADGREMVNVKGKEKGREEMAPAIWIRESLPEDALSIRDAPVSTRPFFCNTTFYTLLRLLQVRFHLTGFLCIPTPFGGPSPPLSLLSRSINVFKIWFGASIAAVFTTIKLQGRGAEICASKVPASSRQSDCGRTWYGRSTGPVERAGTNTAGPGCRGQRGSVVSIYAGSVREALHERAGPGDV